MKECIQDSPDIIPIPMFSAAPIKEPEETVIPITLKETTLGKTTIPNRDMSDEIITQQSKDILKIIPLMEPVEIKTPRSILPHDLRNAPSDKKQVPEIIHQGNQNFTPPILEVDRHSSNTTEPLILARIQDIRTCLGRFTGTRQKYLFTLVKS